MTNNVKEKVFTLTELKRRIAGWRLCSDSIVFTNGCFDLLHLGHIDYLSDAKTLGDRLIVGINSNASVKKLKGETRPINDAESRAVMLASFFFVDAVCIFDEDTPLELITTITPDVLVKGGDYELNQIVGHDVVLKEGGIVKTMPFLEGYSSSDIVSRIKGD